MGVYNCERYLSEVIESLLAQTMSDFEFIIVNDGSTDGTANILDRYATKDKRIRIITQENQGLGSSMNRALELAQGNYIARSDADDFSYPQRLEQQVKFLENHHEVVAVGTSVKLIDPLGIPIRLRAMEHKHEAIEAELLKGNGSAISQPSVMMRADALRNIGGYDSRWLVTEDLDLFLRLAEIGQLANMTEVLVNWRQHLSSANHTKREQQLKESRALLEEAHKKRGLNFCPSKMNKRSEISRPLHLQRWGWNALSKGYRKAALGYAFDSLRAMPFSWQSYKLLGCILRGK